ncbi:MAG TPA: exosortase [Pyrinomonadaceae bacterium]|jgi:exosortase|nr:exosortase [Pyrinomonadaceae bacterium]
MTAATRPQLWKPVTVAAAVLFAYATVLVKLGGQWWVDENYSHGLLIPFIIGYILWSERERLASATVRPSLLWGGALVVLAVLMLWAGTAGAELFMQRTSLVVMLAGIAIYFWGWHILRLALVPLLLLALAIPIPSIIFNQIAFPLQLFASRCAVWAMRAFDIPVLRQGNVIELMPLNSSVTKKLEVVEACSGIRSLMTLLTLAVVFAYFTHPRDPHQRGGGWRAALKRYGTWRSIILVLSAVPIAIITNAGRVSGTGILARYYGTEVADGFFHEFSGWVVYIAAFLLLFALGWVLDKFGARKPPQNKPPRKTAETTEATAIEETTETPIVTPAATPATISLRERGAGGS